MNVRVAVIDYEAGNLRSIARALASVGAVPVFVAAPVDDAFDAVVLPGVGAFGAAMRRLRAAGLVDWITRRVASGTPLVGVCLGMQLLYERSEENGDVPGLALLEGSVRRLPQGLKVPHMGWNQLIIRRPSPVVDGVQGGTHVYFVHSYVAEPAQPADVVAITSYGGEFPAIVQRDGITGLQFHPEKSGAAGARFLARCLSRA
jgi:imidazole glycerol-phosphate synthase subunit HisH